MVNRFRPEWWNYQWDDIGLKRVPAANRPWFGWGRESIVSIVCNKVIVNKLWLTGIKTNHVVMHYFQKKNSMDGRTQMREFFSQKQLNHGRICGVEYAVNIPVMDL